MTKLITITIAIAAFTMSAQAALTPKQFGQLTNWAEQNGYFYKGKDSNLGFPCYVFSSNQEIYGFVPITSDTADEAINALIASTATFRKATLIIRESYSNGYREGMADGMERQRNLTKTSPQFATPAVTPA